MSQRILIAKFRHEDDFLGAVEALRNAGLKIRDAYGPYAVHGMDEALGLAPSRLPWACAAFGFFAAIFMLWFQQWASAVDWPVNVSGKPWNSLPAFAPVIFESAVLAAGLGTVFIFLVVSRLLPGKRPAFPIEGFTDDHFAVVLEETDGRAPPLCFRDVAVESGIVMRHGPGPRHRTLPEDTGSGSPGATTTATATLPT